MESKPKKTKLSLKIKINKNNKQELKEHDNLKNSNESEFSYLYPSLNDPNFNVKLAEKKEFQELKTNTQVKNVEKQAEKVCNKGRFESLQHQLIVKNFMSFQTPYNNLLLFHGLGTGKTCSSILVCEEMRKYFKQFGISKKIIIIASPNVIINFKLQLFDESKLKKVNGLWDLNACTGNNFLKEINPMQMKGLKKENVVRQIKSLIRQYYVFYGTGQFSNKIGELLPKILKKRYSNRLIVIDEVHNLRSSDANDKKITKNFMNLAKHTENLKLLLLSATPMFNNAKEIVWLLNLMNTNDKRPTLKENEIFDKNGELLVDENGKQVGKETLIRKSTGYISYLRGENPYSFPFRIFPSMFMINNTLQTYIQPRFQMNMEVMTQENQLKLLDLCILSLQNYQSAVYQTIIENIKNIQNIKSNKEISGLNYTILTNPLQALNIVYPNLGFSDYIEKLEQGKDPKLFTQVKYLIGKQGLDNVMNYDKVKRENYVYNSEYVNKDKKGIFSPEEIGKYSSKIKFIMNQVENSEGIVLIYSQYIDSGCVPLALALEELGYGRYKRANLFKKPPVPKNNKKYVMITGSPNLSPNNREEIKAVSSSNNINGEKIKVVIISEAGSEGIDFKNIRQIHILDPWWNLNRIEQIIGRGVRNCSHKELDFKKRNVEIFMYGTQLQNEEVESADMYLYRTAEMKAQKIGKISRILKENAMDCLLNKNVMSESLMKQKHVLELSNGEKIEYNIGDKPFSSLCDYMENCEYSCKPNNEINKENMDTYSENFIMTNLEILTHKIKELFKEQYIFHINQLKEKINVLRKYPELQINAALTQIIRNKEPIEDLLNREGTLVNLGEYYMFQPGEITNKNVSAFDRMRPIDIKPKSITIKLPEQLPKKIVMKKKDISILNSYAEYFNEYNGIKEQYELTPREKNITWYQYARNATNRIAQVLPNVKLEILEQCVIEHMLDWSNNNDKLRLYNEVLFYNKVSEPKMEDIVKKIKEVVLKLQPNLEINENITLKNIKQNIENIEKDIKKNVKNTKILEEQVKDLNYLYSLIIKKTTIELIPKLKEVILQRVILFNNKSYIFITDFTEDNPVLFKINEKEKKLQKSTYVELENIYNLIKEKVFKLNEIIGFSSLFKEEKNVAFKIKYTTKKRDTGSRCDQKGKKLILQIIDDILQNKKYSEKNNDKIKGKELCTDQELLLRYFDKENKEGLRWYFNLEEYYFTK